MSPSDQERAAFDVGRWLPTGLAVAALVVAVTALVNGSVHRGKELRPDVVVLKDDETGISTVIQPGNVSFVTAAGTVVLELGLDQDTLGGRIEISSPNAKPVLLLFDRGHGGIIGLANQDGEQVVQMYADEEGDGFVSAFDHEGVQVDALSSR